jgi:CheY-like chemotaxis protein
MGGELNVESQVGVGTLFKVRLYLPTVIMEEELSALTLQMPIAYKGPKRRILVVDNESVDRELLINILKPLGFEVKEAASGAECLQLYPEFQPEIIFMDLAMPEMDGWETIHLIRNIHRFEVLIGIISANAFDKNLENSSGVSDKDFILKPLNLLELINWIGERLNLEWIEPEPSPEPAAPIVPASSLVHSHFLPSRDVLEQLLEMIDMGYVVGVRKLITELDQQDTNYEQFISDIRRMSDNFELESMKIFIERQLANA